MLGSLVMALAYTHVYVDRWNAGAFVTRWRPQVVAGHIISVTGVNAYARTHIALQDKRCIGAIIQMRDNARIGVYVLHRVDAVHLNIANILWTSHSVMMSDMRAFRTWYERRFFEELNGDTLQDDTERTCWDISAFDA